MHADQKGCTRIARQSPFACIPPYPRAFAFPLPVAPASPAPPQRHPMLPRGQLFLPAAPTRPASYAIRARAAGPRAPAIRPPRGPPTPRPPAPFKPSRIDPLNREPTAQPGSTAPSKPSRTDPLNREPGTFPDPDPNSVHRLHETPHVREPWRCAAHAEPAPQARNFCRG